MGSLKEKLEKRKKKKAKRTDEDHSPNEVILKREETRNGNIKSIGKKKRKREKENDVDDGKAVKIKDNLIKAQEENSENGQKETKRKNKRRSNFLVGNSNRSDDGAAEHSSFKSQGNIDNFNQQSEAVTGGGKSKKSKKKKEHHTRKEIVIIREERKNAVEDVVFCISSGEEDSSKGMKKWITEYHQSRPGLKVLQETIDQFITAHEEKLEQERKEREAHAAEDGWTVVVHHRGRKKTTDSESGVTVGSVAPAVAESQLAKKKQKDVGPNFYRFQKRDAKRDEILALQSKYEEGRKRIQELRAARKFRPY